MSGRANVEPVLQSYDAAKVEERVRRAERKAKQEEKKGSEGEKQLKC